MLLWSGGRRLTLERCRAMAEPVQSKPYCNTHSIDGGDRTNHDNTHLYGDREAGVVARASLETFSGGRSFQRIFRLIPTYLIGYAIASAHFWAVEQGHEQGNTSGSESHDSGGAGERVEQINAEFERVDRRQLVVQGASHLLVAAYSLYAK